MKKKRIEWIDVAKGITIILIIIAHNQNLSKPLLNFILSFHIPLFIILTGITTTPPTNKKQLNENIKKNIKRILIPYLLTIITCFFITLIQNITFHNYTIIIKDFLKRLLWGNCLPYNFFGINFNDVSAVWYLITLFLSKLLFDYLNLYLNNDKNKMIIFSFLLLLGIEIGKIIWLPQNLDLVLVFTFYLYIGYLYKNKNIKVNESLCFITMFLIWTICLAFNLNIEIGIRSYPYGIITIIESLCGCYCIIELYKIITNIIFLKRIFSYLGKLSLIILCIHSIELYLIDWNSIKITFTICIIRIFINILLASLIHLNITWYKNTIKKFQ